MTNKENEQPGTHLPPASAALYSRYQVSASQENNQFMNMTNMPPVISNIVKELQSIGGYQQNVALAKHLSNPIGAAGNSGSQIPRHPPSSFVSKRAFGRDLSNI